DRRLEELQESNGEANTSRRDVGGMLSGEMLSAEPNVLGAIPYQPTIWFDKLRGEVNYVPWRRHLYQHLSMHPDGMFQSLLSLIFEDWEKPVIPSMPTKRQLSQQTAGLPKGERERATYFLTKEARREIIYTEGELERW